MLATHLAWPLFLRVLKVVLIQSVALELAYLVLVESLLYKLCTCFHGIPD